MARNNNFALGLTVGIKNLFSRNAQEIRRDYKRLGRENRNLQGSLSDVTAYRDAQTELDRLATSTSATTQEIRNQERAVRRLQRRLTEAGVDTRELTTEQQRLENQLRETQRAADSLDVSGSGMETLASFAGGAGVAFSLASAGGDVNKMERLAAAQTGLSLEDIQSSRNERLDVVEQTGLTSAEVLTAQVQALQSGFKGEEANELVMTSSQIQAAFPLQNQLEVMDAQTRMMRAFGISATQASDLFVAALQKGGDQELDLAKVVKEYAPTYADHGFNAETMMSLLAEGKRSGARDYDSVADPIKEMMNARLSDVDMFKKLMGDKDKIGTIDTLVTDKGLALDVKNALYRVRDGVADGTVENKDFSNLFSTLVKVYELDRKAYRNIVEGVGGSRMAEDIGINQMKAYEKAFSNPNQSLGEYGGKTEQAADIALRPLEVAMAAGRSMFESMATFFTFAENEAEDQIKGGQM
ncbi:phage tail tape measure protein [Shewanella halifaxensis]|uniref:phage tail tape measure protein n=1 Tax=Shewanella halifaxensis TaxID=271098 RepID=UPI000D59347D|nr:phage tail tape measure protein [Shewanella halifaxensis]